MNELIAGSIIHSFGENVEVTELWPLNSESNNGAMDIFEWIVRGVYETAS